MNKGIHTLSTEGKVTDNTRFFVLWEIAVIAAERLTHVYHHDILGIQ